MPYVRSALTASAGDVFVAKLSSSGETKWVQLLGGTDADAGFAVGADMGDNVLVTGQTSSPDFPTSQTPSGAYAGGDTDGFVAKLSPSGKVVWSRFLGDSQSDAVKALAIADGFDIVLTGRTDSADFLKPEGQGEKTAGGQDAFVARVTALGRIEWAKLVGGSDLDEGKAITTDAAGHVFVAGETRSADFQATASFGPKARGTGKGFLAKYDSSGRPVWSSLMGGSQMEVINAIAIDAAGNCRLAGWTDSPDFRVGTVGADDRTSVGRAAFLAESITGWVDQEGSRYLTSGWGGHTLWKYDPELKRELWHYTAPFREGMEYVLRLTTDASGNVYAVGYDGSWYPDGSACVKLDKSGKPLWTSRQRHGTGGDSYGLALALDSAGNLYRVGCDDVPEAPLQRRGRLLGHSAGDGSLILDKAFEPNSTAQAVVVAAADSLYIAGTFNLFAPQGGLSGQCRTVVQKLDRQGRVLWERPLPADGIIVDQNGLLRGGDGSIYVTFQQDNDGRKRPAWRKSRRTGNCSGWDTLTAPAGTCRAQVWRQATARSTSA